MNERPHVLLLAAALTATACYAGSDGAEPPLTSFYFPTGLAVSEDAAILYVVNSDFDLRYTGGTVQSLDLGRLRAFVPRECSGDAECGADERCDMTTTSADPPSFWCVPSRGVGAGQPCGGLGEASAAEQLLRPGRCGHLDPAKPQPGGPSLYLDSVKVSAFATDVLYRRRPAEVGEPGERAAGRLFIPVRGDATLHWLDVDGRGVLDCGQRPGGECDSRHRAGDQPDAENTRGFRLPREPFGIGATGDGEAIVVTHQTQGAVSLFVNDWRSPAGPRLEYVVNGLPSSPSGVVAVPESGATASASPAFLVDFRNTAQLRLFRYYSDEVATPARPFLQEVGAVGIAVNADGRDSRGIAVDGSQRTSCEVGCAEDPTCLAECETIPLRVFVANRSPSSLLVGTLPVRDGVMSPPMITDSIPVSHGPSRVFVGSIIDTSGKLATRIFLVCFDSRRIGVFNPEVGVIESWIVTGRGPHAVALDVGPPGSAEPGHALAYVGHFTDSYVGVVQLDQRQRRTFGKMVLTVGRPEAPRASK